MWWLLLLPTAYADCGCSTCDYCNDWTGYTNKKECLDDTCPDCYICTYPECEDCQDCDCFDTTPYGLFKCQQCIVGETSCSTCNIDLYNLALPSCDCSDCPWDTIETCSYEDDYATCADNEDGNCRPCFECHGLIPATTAPTTQAPTAPTPTTPTTTPAPADAYPYGIIDIMMCPNDPDITLVWTGYHNIKRIVDGEFVEETLSDFLNEGAVRTLKAATLSDWGATTKWGCSLHPTGRITTTCITVLPTFTAQEETIATSTIVGGGAVALMLVGMGIMALA